MRSPSDEAASGDRSERLDFARIFEASPAPQLILAPDLTILGANAAYLSATLTQLGDILGRKLFDVFPEKPGDPLASGASKVRASLARVLQTRAVDTMPVQRYDIPRPAEQGGGFELRYWSPVNSPVLDAGGEVRYLLHRVEDVTDFVHLLAAPLPERWDEAARQRIGALETEMFQRAQERHELNLRLREANAELAAIDRAKTVFFANVSHEFRTPLTLMLGTLAETLASGALAEADRQRLEIAERNARRLLKLVNSLLEFARIEAGRVQATFVPIELARFTRELVSMFASALESAGLALTVDCPPLPEPVYVDPDMWEKVVLNLLTNAFKFTLAGGITVRLRWQDGAAVLTVADTGTGVPPEHLPRLFERFHRVPNARGRSVEGSGIGLALVHELVKLHGGTIEVASVVDQGTRFTIAIPGGSAHLPAERIVAPAPRPASTDNARAFVEEARAWLPESPPAAPAAGAGARILLVDDNADMRRYVHGLLSPHWQVELAADGEEGLAAIARALPDLVLTDVMMPRLDGFGLLRALRADARTRALPVILFSARAGEEARVEGLQAGADDYLVKPFGARELVARVETHLEIARLRQRAVEMAQHDPLTGLANRTLIYEFTERMLAAARRGGTQLAVLFVDMDRFKPINDTYGHAAGDAVLKEIGRRLQACVRGEDSVGRLGGDEFLAVLSHVNGSTGAAHVAQHLIECLGEPYRVDGLELHTSPSVGISLFPHDGADVDTLLRNADAAMYHAKEQGRNNFQFYTRELNENARLSLFVESRLRQGLERGEFELHYQPIVDMAKHELIAVEALLRWPAMGIGPADFVPVAETSGLGEQLGEWVVGEACRQSRRWREQGLPALTLSINVSPQQFRQPALREAIARALAAEGVDAGCLQLELTETTLLKNLDEAIRIMRAIKELGLKIALDGFGEGGSSLSRLGRLPLDTVKVDSAFVGKLGADPASAAITEAIVAIGKALGLQVVAEGIESAEVLSLLRAKDCPRIQGNYVCPPLPAGEFAAWHERWRAAA